MAPVVGDNVNRFKEGEIFSELVVVTQEMLDETEAKKVPSPAKPKLLAFTPRRTKTNAECVLDDARGSLDKIDGIVILYRTKDGSYNFTSDQGDAAGTLFFVEKARLKILDEGEETTKATS